MIPCAKNQVIFLYPVLLLKSLMIFWSFCTFAILHPVVENSLKLCYTLFGVPKTRPCWAAHAHNYTVATVMEYPLSRERERQTCFLSKDAMQYIQDQVLSHQPSNLPTGSEVWFSSGCCVVLLIGWLVVWAWSLQSYCCLIRQDILIHDCFTPPRHMHVNALCYQTRNTQYFICMHL